jgi:hypothetical protein
MCQFISRVYAGVDFWGKKTLLDNYLSNGKAPYAFTKDEIDKLSRNQFKNNYNISFKALTTKTTSYEDIKNNFGGFYINECSFAPKELKDEYDEKKASYDKSVQQLFQLLAASDNLKVCYNQAQQSGNNYNINGENNTVLDCNSITQIMNCCEDENDKLLKQIEEASKGNSKSLEARVDLLENSILEIRKSISNISDDETQEARLNVLLDEAMKKRMTEIQEDIKTINSYLLTVVICVIVLFLIVVFGFGFTVMKINRIKK